MALRPCIECGRISEGTRCPEHSLGTTTTERGYGWTHQQALQDPAFQAVEHCQHCGDPFTPDNPRAGGHRQAHRHGGADGDLVAHCRRCNSGWRATGL